MRKRLKPFSSQHAVLSGREHYRSLYQTSAFSRAALQWQPERLDHCSCYTRPGQTSVLRLTEVQPDELHHVRLQQVHVPPGHTFRPGQGACVHIEEGTSAAVDSFLRNATQIRADLHRSLSCSHVQNCKQQYSLITAPRHNTMRYRIGKEFQTGARWPETAPKISIQPAAKWILVYSLPINRTEKALYWQKRISSIQDALYR